MFDFLHHPWLQNYQKWKNRKIWAGTYSSSSSISGSEQSISFQEGQDIGFDQNTNLKDTVNKIIGGRQDSESDDSE